MTLGITAEDYTLIRRDAEKRRRRFAAAVKEVEAEIASVLPSGVRLELTGTDFLCFADGTKSAIPIAHHYRVYEAVGEMFFRSNKERTHIELELDSDLSARIVVFSKPVQSPLLAAKIEQIVKTVFDKSLYRMQSE
jgi:hypothetical protein